MSFISIFTPTYNRGEYLKRIFKSLKYQSFRDFEWLIIDDGSTDNTRDIVEELQGIAEFPIIYHYKENGGKHTAINVGTEIASGKYFYFCDSDEILLKKSLSEIYPKLLIELDDNKTYAVIANRVDSAEECLGIELPNGTKGSYLEFAMKNKAGGDYTWIVKTEILRKYKFPVFPNENFCTEALVLNRIDKDYNIVYYNCNLNMGNYMDDGLTSNIRDIWKRNPLGMILYYKELVLNNRVKLLHKIYYNYLYWEARAGVTLEKYYQLHPTTWMYVLRPISYILCTIHSYLKSI